MGQCGVRLRVHTEDGGSSGGPLPGVPHAVLYAGRVSACACVLSVPACLLSFPTCLLRPHCDVDGKQHYGHQYVEDQGRQKRPTVLGRQLAFQVAEAQGAEEEEAQNRAG